MDAAATALASLRARLAALGPAPADGPWAAPTSLHAAAAGDRPTGIATAIGGFGGDDDVRLTDRAHAPTAPLSAAGRALHDRFVAALDDDLDLPTALAVVRETLRADLPVDERRWLVLDADAVLGLDLDRTDTGRGAGARATNEAPAALPADIAALVGDRTAARAAGDFARADALRDELLAGGWDVTDTPDGPVRDPPLNRAPSPGRPAVASPGEAAPRPRGHPRPLPGPR